MANSVRKLNITPPKVEPKLLQLVKQTIAASEYFDSIEFRKKTFPKRIRTTSENAMEIVEHEEKEAEVSRKYNSIDNLMASMDWDRWVEETKWKRFDSDTASWEEENFVPGSKG